MTTNFHSGSAQIYQFPVRVRAGVASHREDVSPAAVLTLPQIAKVVFGSSWYHEEAVQEAERASKQ
jgi:hypothetical protein